MPFTPKNWIDAPNTSTPISAAALEDLEERVTDYADSVGGGGPADNILTLGVDVPLINGWTKAAASGDGLHRGRIYTQGGRGYASGAIVAPATMAPAFVLPDEFAPYRYGHDTADFELEYFAYLNSGDFARVGFGFDWTAAGEFSMFTAKDSAGADVAEGTYVFLDSVQWLLASAV